MAKENLLKLFILLIVCKIKISTCDSRIVPCSMPYDNRNCTIIGLTLNLKNHTFKPFALNPNIVIGFEIKKSTVPVITSEICTSFPQLQSFVAVQQGIQVIDDYAFNNCTEVLLINMPFNNIHTLGKGLFDNTRKLQEINVHGGSISQIDVNLFDNLGELNELVISGNKLKELPIAALKNLKKLKILYIYSNELNDLDANGLVRSLPNLRAIFINDNNFHCDRLIEILNIFKAKSIIISDHAHSIYVRKRDYFPHKIENIICLTQVEIEFEKMKTALNSSLDELKELPIGKAVIQLKDMVNSGFADADSNIVNLSNTFNETSDNLNQQLFYVNQTLNATTTKIQEISDALGHMMDKYNTFMANFSNNSQYKENNIILISLICFVLVITAITFFVYKRLKKSRLDVPFTYHKNDSILLNDELQQNI